MPHLDYRKFTISRIDSFIKQIDLAREIDFPYDDSKDALEKISEHISLHLSEVENFPSSNESALQSECKTATFQLFIFQKYLGCIAKSAEPQNSFEAYAPLRRIAESILGEGVKLIISSEWEHYSPVNFGIPNQLRDFVFIGSPVSEINNALVVPLSGHELGHSIWFRFDFTERYRGVVQNELPDSLKDRENRKICTAITLSKCEEYFCDFVGIGLFGESYLYAYSYFISPQITDRLNTSHPNAVYRGRAMEKAAQEFGYIVPPNFKDLFKTIIPEENRKNDNELLELSEEISFKIVEYLIKDTKQLLSDKKTIYKKSDVHGIFENELKSLVPISTAKTLADITNAAWDVYFTEEKWNGIFKKPNKEEKESIFLNELTLKSFEILEIRQRLGEL